MKKIKGFLCFLLAISLLLVPSTLLKASVGDVFSADIMVGGVSTPCILKVLTEAPGDYTVQIGDDSGVTAIPPTATGALELPNTVTYSGNDYTVTRIGDYAFFSLGITSTGLGSNTSITDIGASAFYGCTSLMDSELSSNSTVEHIGMYSFAWCTALVGDLVIMPQVSFIELGAFSNTDYEKIYLLQDTAPTIYSAAFQFLSGSGIMYVPETWSSGDDFLDYSTSDDTLIYMITPLLTDLSLQRTAPDAAQLQFNSNIPNETTLDVAGVNQQVQVLAGDNSILLGSIPDSAFNTTYEAVAVYGQSPQWYNTVLSRGAIPLAAWNYHLKVNAGEGGSVSSSGGDYPAGTSIDLLATADEGYEFIGWTADGVTVDNNRSLQFNMPSNDVTLTANFKKSESTAIHRLPKTGSQMAVVGMLTLLLGTTLLIKTKRLY